MNKKLKDYSREILWIWELFRKNKNNNINYFKSKQATKRTKIIKEWIKIFKLWFVSMLQIKRKTKKLKKRLDEELN